jgi:hypothetical protein
MRYSVCGPTGPVFLLFRCSPKRVRSQGSSTRPRSALSKTGHVSLRLSVGPWVGELLEQVVGGLLGQAARPRLVISVPAAQIGWTLNPGEPPATGPPADSSVIDDAPWVVLVLICLRSYPSTAWIKACGGWHVSDNGAVRGRAGPKRRVIVEIPEYLTLREVEAVELPALGCGNRARLRGGNRDC